MPKKPVIPPLSDDDRRRNKVNTPSQIRNRLRRKTRNFEKDAALYLEVVVKKPLEEWDLEELARGRPRDKRGLFGGRTPEWITPLIQLEIKRRLRSDTMGMMAKYLPQAVEAIGNLIESEEVDLNGKPIVDAKTKLAASQFVIEHFTGKPNQVVDVQPGEGVVKEALVKTFLLPDGSPKHQIIEGSYQIDGADDDIEVEMEEIDDDDSI